MQTVAIYRNGWVMACSTALDTLQDQAMQGSIQGNIQNNTRINQQGNIQNNTPYIIWEDNIRKYKPKL